MQCTSLTFYYRHSLTLKHLDFRLSRNDFLKASVWAAQIVLAQSAPSNFPVPSSGVVLAPARISGEGSILCTVLLTFCYLRWVFRSSPVCFSRLIICAFRIMLLDLFLCIPTQMKNTHFAENRITLPPLGHVWRVLRVI